MGRTAGRSAGDTRGMVLDAARDLFLRRGMAATLDAIAQHAGVSKGGLIYHFPSKDHLITALVESLLDAFRRAVHEHLDPDDDRPGRLARAYVRACLHVQDPGAVREDTILIAQLITNPAVIDIARSDARRWRDDLTADGLPGRVVSLVMAAADGASMAVLWGGEASEAEKEELARQLIDLTLDPT